MANDTIFIRNTEARRAQLDWLAKRMRRDSDTDNIDFALSFTIATMRGAETSRVVVTGFEPRVDGLAAIPNIEAQVVALVDGILAGGVTRQEAKGRAVELVRLAGCAALAAWAKSDDAD